MKELIQQVIADFVNMTPLKFMLIHPVIYFFSVAVILVAGYFGLTIADKIREKLSKK